MTSDAAIIFVYGTLRREGAQHSRLGDAEWLGEATFQGALYAVSWYPALVRKQGAQELVVGECYQVSAGVLSALDEYEGDDYQRELMEVTLSDGRQLLAYLWVWKQAYEHLKPIASGDWVAYSYTQSLYNHSEIS